ncbi:MAG: VacJ family lipoprotein [Thermohalobaculum sp.]|nr:VacJ family lipoprotein [Thermohalobaculum sp.]
MSFIRFLCNSVTGAALLTLAACASTDPDAGFAAQDPFESTNRTIHSFNVGVDRYVLRPVAQGYDTVTPATFQHMIGNGLSHLQLPVDMANHFLQGQTMAGLRTMGRITLNTVLGMGGLLDPATEFGLPREETDFGITLGRWGVDQGAFLMIPLIGPSTPRDIGGFVVDLAFSPTTYFGISGSDTLNTLSIPLNVVDRVDTRNRNADLIDELLYESDDSYVTVRSIYLQRRAAQVAGGDVTDALPDIFEEEEATPAPAN